MSYNDVPPFRYATLSATGWTASATNGTQIKGTSAGSAPGILNSIYIGTATSGTITFYDNNTSTGTIIVIVNQSSTGFFYLGDVEFNNGLCANCSASGATATVSYL